MLSLETRIREWFASRRTIPLGPRYDTIPMPMKRLRLAFRRFALAIATAQLLAFAFAPVLEGITVEAHRTAEVAFRTEGTAPTAAHNVETCVACQVMSTLASLPRSEAQELPASTAPEREWLTLAIPANGFQRQGLHSRAPPVLPS